MIFNRVVSQNVATYLNRYETNTQYALANMRPEHLGIWGLKQLNYTEAIVTRVVQMIQKSQYSHHEKTELVAILTYLFNAALPVFVLGMDKNPLHHNVQVVENILHIMLEEERFCDYQLTRKAAILALLHDIGTGLVEPDVEKVTRGDILSRFQELKEKRETHTDINPEIQALIKTLETFRNAHMVEGAKIAGALLHEMNCDEEAIQDITLPEEDIQEITYCIAIHDVPSIVESYEQAGKKIHKDALLPLDHDLATILREADRLWMVSKEGLEKNLFDVLKKGSPPVPLEILRHNVKRFKDEYTLYSHAVDITPHQLSQFKARTLFRSDSGFQLLVRYVFERVQDILGISTVNIAVSLGGTKLGIALVFGGGIVLEIVPAIDWRSEFAIDESERHADALTDRIIEKLTSAITFLDNTTGQNTLGKIGISTKGPIDVVNGVKILGKGKKLTTLPFKDDPLEEIILTKLRKTYASRHVEVELIHDGIAAILGEVSPGGTLKDQKNAAAIIIGSGIGIGIVENGTIAHEELGSLGRYLIHVTEDDAYHYMFMTNSTGNEPIRELANLPGEYEHYRGRVTHFSERIAGPWLAERLARELILENKPAFFQALEHVSGGIITPTTIKAYLDQPERHKNIEKALLVNLTNAAKHGCSESRDFVISVAEETGVALSEFIFRYRDEEFVKHIVLVSSVAENFGKGVKDTERNDLFINTIQKKVQACLEEKGVPAGIASECAQGIKRSNISVEREFLAFTP